MVAEARWRDQVSGGNGARIVADMSDQGFDPPQGELEGQPGGLIGEASLHARRAPGNTCLSALDPPGMSRAATLARVTTSR
jgi:hypothetical protein